MFILRVLLFSPQKRIKWKTTYMYTTPSELLQNSAGNRGNRGTPSTHRHCWVGTFTSILYDGFNGVRVAQYLVLCVVFSVCPFLALPMWQTCNDKINLIIVTVLGLRVKFNTTFNNISAISWRSALLVEETEAPGENRRPVACHWQILSHAVSSTCLHEWDSNSQL